MKEMIRKRSWMVLCVVAGLLLCSCSKLPDGTGTLTVQLKNVPSQEISVWVYPYVSENPSQIPYRARIEEHTFRAGQTTVSFTLNAGDYYLFFYASESSWRAAQVQQGRETVVKYP